ncbi:hypothetical protein SELMODRAFT_423018 [Selaginella moellendorffii]|uniref:Uncharacterized protein n=1 Tax=Selaginella moellendorffii TaxID=88036 RepID=D8SKA9_SELML|nr:hypothetical protein SELMODRAFT_423018 [Selaginella moellendorffii]
MAVRVFLKSQIHGKAGVIDTSVQILEAQGYEYVGELEQLTYEEVIGVKVPLFAAKTLQRLLKQPASVFQSLGLLKEGLVEERNTPRNSAIEKLLQCWHIGHKDEQGLIHHKRIQRKTHPLDVP